MTEYAQLPPDELSNPLLEWNYQRPNWRVIEAKKSKQDTHSDPYINELLQCYFHAQWAKYPAVHAAVKLYQNFRLNVTAMIIGGASDDVIGLAVGAKPMAIEYYRRLYFDVDPDSPVLVKEKSVLDFASDPREKKILLFSLVNGWQVFLRTCGKDGHLLADQYNKLSTTALKNKALKIIENRLAEQEIATTGSPLYNQDGLLKAILQTADKEEEERRSGLQEQIQELAAKINKSDSENDKVLTRDRVEFYNDTVEEQDGRTSEDTEHSG